nr:MAG TPA: hypothetical protein [Caudoviricetes sp.]DAT15124.1 MAG TPA: hypothetical protein [Caudoviricetes sp.]
MLKFWLFKQARASLDGRNFGLAACNGKPIL